jgi:hypothetical protein
MGNVLNVENASVFVLLEQLFLLKVILTVRFFHPVSLSYLFIEKEVALEEVEGWGEEENGCVEVFEIKNGEF